ncbi:hypothetical protein Tco_1103022 [Tanacetum coccineum]
MGEPLSPDHVFNFLKDELKPHPTYYFFAPAPLPGYAGNPNNNNGWLEADDYLLGEIEAMVDEQMVVPAIEEVAEPAVEAKEEQVITPAVDMDEGQMDVPVIDMEEDLDALFGDDDFKDDASDRFGKEEVWEVNKDWLMDPTTPPPMLVVPPPSVIGCRSIYLRFQRTVLIPSTPALGLPVPPFVIEDLSIRLGNLEYGHGQLVKKVIQVMASQMIHAVDIVEQVGAQVEQGQQTAAQRDETIAELTQQGEHIDAVHFGIGETDCSIEEKTIRYLEEPRYVGKIVTVKMLDNMRMNVMGQLRKKKIICPANGFYNARHPTPLTAWRESSHHDRIPKWVEAELVSPEVESEKWRRLLLHSMSVAFYVSTDGREEDFFPRNGM